MERRSQLLRWFGAVGLSALVHLLVFGLAMARMLAMPELPRVEIIPVRGVPASPFAATAPPEPEAPPPREPEEPAEPEVPRTEGEARPEPPPEPPVEPSAPAGGAELVERDSGERPPQSEPDEPPEEAVDQDQDPPSEGPEQPPAEETAEAEPPIELALPVAIAEGELEGVVDGAKVALLVRTERISSSPHAQPIRRVIRAVPGFGFYMGERAFDPLTDFRWMSVRTPDLRSVVRTLLVAELAIEGARAKATIDRMAPPGEAMSWAAGEGYDLARAPEKASPPVRTLAWALRSEGGLLAIGPEPWVGTAMESPEALTADPLPTLGEITLRGEEPDLVLAADHLELVVELEGEELAGPSTLVMAARFGEPTPIALRAWFETPEQAERFLAAARGQISRAAEHPLAALVDLPAMVESLELRQEDASLIGTVELSASQAERVLRVAAMILRRRQQGFGAEREDTN